MGLLLVIHEGSLAREHLCTGTNLAGELFLFKLVPPLHVAPAVLLAGERLWTPSNLAPDHLWPVVRLCHVAQAVLLAAERLYTPSNLALNLVIFFVHFLMPFHTSKISTYFFAIPEFALVTPFYFLKCNRWFMVLLLQIA